MLVGLATGLLDADGAISAGDGGQAPAIAGAAGSAGSLVSGGSGGAPSTGMGGTDDAAGAPAEIGGASGMNGLGWLERFRCLERQRGFGWFERQRGFERLGRQSGFERLGRLGRQSWLGW